MGKTKERLIIIAVTILSIVFFFYDLTAVFHSRRAVKGITDPVQTEATGHANKYAGGFHVNITYKYAYDIEGLVVSTKNYVGTDPSAALAPRDIGLAWGQVAARNDKINFHWHQSNRWLSWTIYNEDDLFTMGGTDMIGCQTSNNHLIASDVIAERQIKKIKAGDHIRIKGYLVDCSGTKPDGSYFTWNSSTSRTDTGNGACEVIYVTDVIFLD